MKTPDEIKKALECCYGHAERRFCEECPLGAKVEGYSEVICTDFDSTGEGALAYIRQLEAQLVNQATEYSQALKITTEQRDAAVDDIELGVRCETCKHDNDDDEGVFCVGCLGVTSRGNWEWRGVKSDAE